MNQLATAIDNPLHLCRLCGHPESAHCDCSLSGRPEGRCRDCWPRKDLASLPADHTLIEGSDQYRAYHFADHRFTPKPYGLDILRIGGGDKPAVVIRFLADRPLQLIPVIRAIMNCVEFVKLFSGHWSLTWKGNDASTPQSEISNPQSPEAP